MCIRDRHETEQWLKALRQPPDELRPEEQAVLQPIMARLIAHLDQMSIDAVSYTHLSH